MAASDRPTDGTSHSRSERGGSKGSQVHNSALINPAAKHSTPRLVHDHSRKQLYARASPRPTWSEWLWGSRIGQWCLLFMTAAALISCNISAWIAVGGNNDYNTSFIQSLWISWGLFFDPGTQTGILATDPPAVMAVALLFSVLGFIWNLSVLGMIVEIVRTKLDTWRKERDREYVDHHVLILGWTDKTLFLLKEMIHEANSCSVRREMDWRDFVVLSDRDELEMKRDINNFIDAQKDLQQHWSFPHFEFLPSTFGRGRGCLSRLWCRRGHRVLCRTGCPYDINDLLAVSVGFARDIIVLGKSGPPRSSDLEVVRVAVALSSLPSKNALHEELSGRMIVETRTTEMAPVLEALVLDHNGTSLCQPIHARSSVNRLLCLLATKPVCGDCFVSLCAFSFGEEVYAVEVPQLCGQTFADACKLQTRAVCIGVKVEKKAEVNSLKVSWTDTEGIVSTLEVEGGQLKWSAPKITKRTVDKLTITIGREGKLTIWGAFGSSTIAQPPAGPGQLSVLAEIARIAEEVRVPVAGEAMDKLRESKAAAANFPGGSVDSIILAPPDNYIFGKKDTLLLIAADEAASAEAFAVERTETRVPRSDYSQLELVNPVVPGMELLNVEGELQASIDGPAGAVIIIAGFADDFVDLMQMLDFYVPPNTIVHVLSRKSIEQRKQSITDHLEDLTKITIEHYVGERTDLDAIVKLPFKKASAVLVLAESELEEDADDMCDSTFLNDSACLAIAVLIAGVCDGRYGMEYKADLKSKIICEVLDSRTDQLLHRNQRLKATGPGIKFFRSSALETGMFAMAASDPTSFNVLVLLLSPNGVGNIAAVPPSRYIGPNERCSFWELHAKVRQPAGDLLLGWRQNGSRYQTLAPDIDRYDRRTWDEVEKLIIIKKPPVEEGSSEYSAAVPEM